MRQKSLAFVLVFLRVVMGLVLISFGPALLAQTLAQLESPSSSSFQESGVSLIRGWVCKATQVEISIDDGPRLAAAYGTERLDTAGVCGDTNNGFGLTYNWGEVGDGIHTVRAFADNVEFANVSFAITTLGGKFLTGLRGQYTLSDFPVAGNSATLRWSQAHQNFVLVSPITIQPVNDPPVLPGAMLESPIQDSSESGVSLIRGWVCTASRVEVSIDGGPRLATAYGTDRPDTVEACGDTNNGFGLTYNWNRAGNGPHNLRAFADGVEFANVNFAVTTLGGEFLTGLRSKLRLLDFPGTGPAAAQILADSGRTTTVEWSEPHQNFLISTTTATGEKLALVSAITDARNRFAVLGVGAIPASQTTTTGVQVVKDVAGEATQITGVTWADTQSGGWADVLLGSDSLPATYRDSSGGEARLSNYTATAVEVRFFGPAGQLLAGPVTTPLNVELVRKLQELAIRVQQTATSTSATSATAVTGIAPQASSATRFSLKPLLAEMLGTGSTAASELLCALQRATSTAGVGNLIAPTACQSPLLQGFLALASTAQTTAAGGLSPALQQALLYNSDVAPTPCDLASASTACLTPAATELQARAAEPVPELPWQAPPTPTPPPSERRSYSGTWEHCSTVTTNYGVRQTCSNCGSGPAQITLQNGSILLNALAWDTSYEVNTNGNCRGVTVAFEGPLSWTFENAYANGRFSFSYTITTQDGASHPINIQGSYSDTALSASGSVSYTTQLSAGSVTIVDQDRFSLSGSQ
jgi:hypothetical protein